MLGDLRDFLNKKNIINLLILGILVLGIPVATELVRTQQILKSRATLNPVEVVVDGTRVVKRVVNGQEKVLATSPVVTVKLSTPAEFLSTQQVNSFGIGTVYAQACNGTVYSCSDIKCADGSTASGTGCYETGGDPNNRYRTECLRNCPAPPAPGAASPPTLQPGGQQTDGQGCAGSDGIQRRGAQATGIECTGYVAATGSDVLSKNGVNGHKSCDGQYFAENPYLFSSCVNKSETGRAPASCFLYISEPDQDKCITAELHLSRVPENSERAVINFLPGSDSQNYVASKNTDNLVSGITAPSDPRYFRTKSCYSQLGTYTITGSIDYQAKTLCNNSVLSERQKTVTISAASTPAVGQPAPAPAVGVGATAPPPSAAARVVRYRISTTIDGLNNSASEFTFAGDGMTHEFSIPNPVPSNTYAILVRFIGANGRTVDKNTSIVFAGSDPVVSGAACTVDLQDNSLVFTLGGSNFGSRDFEKSTVRADGANLEILEWFDRSADSLGPGLVKARWTNPPDTTTGRTFAITLNRADGARASATCSINTAQITLGVKLFCRAPSSFDQDDVELSVFEITPAGSTANSAAASRTREKVTINKEGVIQNLKTRLKESARYVICLKAPKSLRACTDEFTASSGNNLIKDFTLPVGDLNGDGIINTVDAGMLRNQWGPVRPNKTCDFNKDGFCNSFEWGCMLHDFNSRNMSEPN